MTNEQAAKALDDADQRAVYLVATGEGNRAIRLYHQAVRLVIAELRALVELRVNPEQGKAVAMKCMKCEGGGQIADDEDGSPWTAWAELPEASAIAIRMGLVKPLPCPVCNGRGTLPEQGKAVTK